MSGTFISTRLSRAIAIFASFAIAIGLSCIHPVVADAKTNNKVAIVYFSCTGTTKSVAKKIQRATKGKIVQIKASRPYTSKDLDYNNDNSRVNREMSSASTPAKSKIRPSIKNLSAIKKAVKGAKTVYIGYPIWWGEAPHIMYSMIEKVSLKGKKVVPFTTSGSSGTGSSSKHLKSKAIISSKTKWKAGKSFYGPSTQTIINKWVKTVK